MGVKWGMAKKKTRKSVKSAKLNRLPFWALWTIGLLGSVFLIAFVSLQIWMSTWKTYMVDNFLSFKYPPTWHLQQENEKTLAGYENLFILSDFRGQLSLQDASSPSQVYIIGANRILKSKVKNIEANISPYLLLCDSIKCEANVSKLNLSGFKIVEAELNFLGKSFYRKQFVISVEGPVYDYTISLGFIPRGIEIENVFREVLLQKVINSIHLIKK